MFYISPTVHPLRSCALPPVRHCIFILAVNLWKLKCRIGNLVFQSIYYVCVFRNFSILIVIIALTPSCPRWWCPKMMNWTLSRRAPGPSSTSLTAGNHQHSLDEDVDQRLGWRHLASIIIWICWWLLAVRDVGDGPGPGALLDNVQFIILWCCRSLANIGTAWC